MIKDLSFLVATHAYLTYVTITNSWEIRSCDILSRGHHYGLGIYPHNNNRFIAKGGSGGDQFLQVYERNTNRPDLIFEVVKRIELVGKNRFIHQIVKDGNAIYYANTDYNSVVKIDSNGENCLSYNFASKATDINHVNSIYPINKKNILCLLHNRGEKLSEVALVKLLAEEKRFVLKSTVPIWDFGCHNVFTDGNILAYNASNVGHFVVIDLKKQRVIKRLVFDGHTKGLSVLKDIFIVGFSDHAERHSRKSSNGYLAIIRRKDYKILCKIKLNPESSKLPIGNVNEIRCLSHYDHGHFPPELNTAIFENLKLSKSDLLWRLKNKLGRLYQAA